MPAAARAKTAPVTFYSDTLRLASLTRLDWQQELTQAIQKDELELHYQPRLLLVDARDHRGRSVPALASQDSRPGAHLGIPAHRRALRPVGAARPLGVAPRLPRPRHAGRARLPAPARLGQCRPPVSVRRKSRRRRRQFRARSRHRAFATRSRNHRTDVVHGPHRPRGAASAARPGRARTHRRFRHRLHFARQAAQLARSTAS